MHDSMDKRIDSLLFVIPAWESPTVKDSGSSFVFCKNREVIMAVMENKNEIAAAHNIMLTSVFHEPVARFHKIINHYGYYYKKPGSHWSHVSGFEAIPVGLLSGSDPDEYMFVAEGFVLDKAALQEMIAKLIMETIHG